MKRLTNILLLMLYILVTSLCPRVHVESFRRKHLSHRD